MRREHDPSFFVPPWLHNVKGLGESTTNTKPMKPTDSVLLWMLVQDAMPTEW